jgi:hypothetical protein
MPYLGRPLISDKTTKTKKIDSIASSFNGAQTVFALNSSGTTVYPASSRNLFVSINGVLQEPDVAYTINAATITFTSAPTTNATFFCVVNGEPNDLLLTPSVTTLTVGANVSANSTTVFVGNSTSNTAITSGGVTVNGNSPWLSQTFRGLTLRTHHDADVAASKVYLDHADEIVMHNGVRVADWDDLAADITASGAGGLDTGSEGASRWYSIHAIRKSSDGTKNLLLHRAKDYGADQSFTTVGDTGNYLRTLTGTATDKIAQGFQLTTAGYVPFVDVTLVKSSSPVGNYWFTIEADSGGNPSGTALATSDKYDASLVATSTQLIRVVFRTPASLSASTQYHLVWQGDYTRSSSNVVQWKGVVAGGYANGSSKDFNGTSWSATPGVSGLDRLFKLYVTQNDTALTLPSGYDQYALIGYVYNDSGSNFQGFAQFNRTVEVHSTSSNYATVFSTGTFTATFQTLFSFDAVIPPIPVMVRLNGANDTVGAYVVVSGKLSPGAFPRGSGAQYLYSSVGSSTNPSFTFQPLILEFQHLYAYVGSGTGRIYVDGWEW